MESKKIKEIKDKLKEEIFIANSFGDKLRKVPTKELENLLTLINELESENERWQKDCADIANDYQEMGSFYYEEVKKNQQLKDRIAELEKENESLKKQLIAIDTLDETNFEKRHNAIVFITEKQLKQFAERLKEKVYDSFGDKVIWYYDIDETLKEFINE